MAAKIIAHLIDVDGSITQRISVSSTVLKQKKPFEIIQTAFHNLIPATTYSPTQLPAQYHRLKRA